jgi:glycerol uptake facilitator-like aquaporin
LPQNFTSRSCVVREIVSKGDRMTSDSYAVQQPRSISAALEHGRLGSAFAAAIVAIVLLASICAIVLLIGTDAALAASRQLATVDDGSASNGVIGMVIGISVIMMLLASVAFNGLTPSQARRRRSKR